MRLIISSLLSMIFSFCFMFNLASAQDADIPRIDASQLVSTTVTSYMKSDIAAEKNLIYCSTFQLAWNQLIDDIIKAPLQLSDDPTIARMLNQRLTGKEDLSPDCYVAMAGFKKDGIEEKIKQALKTKFNITPGIDISLERPDDILAYAFLFKDLKFDNEFQNIENPLYFQGSVGVEAFGIEKFGAQMPALNSLNKVEHKNIVQNLMKQVEVLDYKNNDDFIISLKTKSPNDELIFAKTTPGKTLLETIDIVISRIIASSPSSLKVGEYLKIPKLDFNILKEYRDLVRRSCLNKGFETYFISKAIQSIRFKLNEKGAYLKSEAAISMAKSIAVSNDLPRSFILNKPFLILLRQKGAKYPYFAMWINNAELLIKKNKSIGY